MPGSAKWFVFLHVLSALWLAAGAFASAVVRAQSRKAPTLQEKAFGLRLGRRLFLIFGLPGGLVAGLVGMYLVTARGFAWSERWVQASVALWALVMVLLLAVVAPRLAKMLREAERSLAAGAPTPEFLALVSARWLGIVADFNLLAIVVLVLLMVFKPA